jgi:asparagine synthase (glutamine-hydrolysing)
MCDTIVHRGPDDEGHFVSGSVGLGMRRLSIIDPAGGKQPVCNEDATIRVVSNGEIYNYRELRSELEAQGHSFRSRSDTEVIVHAFEEYGEACLDKLRGMFAFALWDARHQNLMLAVDRFGIKPLYYAINNEGIVFASELQCLLACGTVTGEIDYSGLAQYFTLGYIPAPDTIFRVVRKLAPGYRLQWTPTAGPLVESYWDWPRNDVEHRRPSVLVRHELREALKDAVRSHLVSDVPLGVFLSGGIDSSTVVALMSELSAEPVKTFTIGFDDREHDESNRALLVAHRFRTDHHQFMVEPEMVDALPRIVAHFAEPFADSSALPTYYVSKMARQYVKVALSGDGGDELFLGYTVFRGLELARYVQSLPIFARRAISAIPTLLPHIASPVWNDRIQSWSKRVADSMLPVEQAYRSKSTMVRLSTLWPLLSPNLQEQLKGRDPYRAMDDCLAHWLPGSNVHPLERFLYLGLRIALAGDMLVKVDRMSMANSLEVRVPLLDHVLAEYVATIPIEQRFPHWRLKGLLKDTMADTLPPKILHQRKHGFTVPLAKWFRGDLAAFAADVLLSSNARERGWWNMDAMEAVLEGHRKGAHNLGIVIWSLLILELWCQRVGSICVF